MSDSKNIMVTGGIPKGTWTKFLTWEEEVIEVDPKIIMQMNETLNPRPPLKYGE